MMKILYINPSSQLGGAERNLIDVICAVRQQDPSVKIVVIITAADGPIVAELRELAVEIVLLELPRKIAQMGDSGLKSQSKITSIFKLAISGISISGEFMRYRENLRRTVAKIRPDLIHSNGLKTHLLIASLRTDLPIVWHLHDFIGSRPSIGKLLGFFSQKVTMGIAISNAIALDWRLVFPKLPIEVIYNAIDIDKFQPPAIDRSLISDSQDLKVGLVATYSIWKGHDVFIQAIGHIAKQRPELKSTVKFYIIGGAIYETDRSQYSRSTLQQLVRDLDIEEWLVFIDFQRDIIASYQMLDIVVHASTQPEPFGRTIVEAMACEKAVILANTGGAAELFTHQQDAIGVPPGDPVALAAAILDLIDNPAKRVMMGKAGRITAIERFNRDRLGVELMSLYSKQLTK